ncbi:hypothetical protein B0H19DRAFT_1079410 [Mycena capillaripes]|nr:hypothetical protein B0H19DRAFT_1079410 [Mycena capillaripes]
MEATNDLSERRRKEMLMNAEALEERYPHMRLAAHSRLFCVSETNVQGIEEHEWTLSVRHRALFPFIFSSRWLFIAHYALPASRYFTLTRQFAVRYSSPSLTSEMVDSAHSDVLAACESDSSRRTSTEKRRACGNEVPPSITLWVSDSYALVLPFLIIYRGGPASSQSDRHSRNFSKTEVKAEGGGIYYTRVVHNMNNEFTEDKQVVVRWALNKLNKPRVRVRGSEHIRVAGQCTYQAVLSSKYYGPGTLPMAIDVRGAIYMYYLSDSTPVVIFLSFCKRIGHLGVEFRK